MVDRGGRRIAHASVLVLAADASCTPLGGDVGAVTDESGEFVAVVESDAPSAGCVVVEARSGGASGVATATVQFTNASPRVRVDVRLDRPQPLTAGESERLVRLLADAINDPAKDTADLGLHILHGPEALRVALEHYRIILGRVTNVRPATSDMPAPRRFTFELVAPGGRTSKLDVYQEELTRLHSPVLDYGFRSERFISAYLRTISAGDAVRLSQVLNPDDIDFPVEKARAMIEDYRRRYRDVAAIRPELVSVDERAIRWRLRGIGPDGKEVTETLELGFGDGLIGIRGLND